tara:strand:- start:332 stop:565 length:234 start_codon:yes stop_codon:yes gene_type:complete
MTYHFKIFALALLVSGCSALENKLTHYSDPLLVPPDVIGVHCVCDKPEQLLICTDESLTDCQGFLEDKPITIEETEL